MGADEYTPSVDEARMFYEAGRSAMRRASTGEQIIDIGPFTAEFDRMIEATRVGAVESFDKGELSAGCRCYPADEYEVDA